jgi:hypothetical protein
MACDFAREIVDAVQPPPRILKRRVTLREVSEKFRVLADTANQLADEIEAHIMKKTTQESPEWHGKANK